MKFQLLPIVRTSAMLATAAAAQQPAPPADDKSLSSAMVCPAHDSVTQADDHAKE